MSTGARTAGFKRAHLFWGSILLLVAVTAVAAFSTYRLIDQYSAAERDQQTIVRLDRLLSHVKDIESRARGFALTLDRQMLAAFRHDVAGLDQSLGELREAARRDPELAEGLAQVERASRERVQMASKIVETSAARGRVSELAELALAGERIGRDVRAEIAEAAAAKERERLRHVRLLERQAMVAIAALALSVLFVAAILTWLFRAVRGEAGQRAKVEQQLRSLNSDLEQRVLERTVEVERSRILLDTIIENMPDTVYLKDADQDSSYVLLNSAGEKLFGHAREEVIGRSDTQLFSSEEAENSSREEERLLNGQAQSLIVEREITTPQGKRIVEARKLAVAGPNGRKSLILGIVRDVTEQRLLESQVREMQRLDSVGRLTGGIAHDFNNLLAVIMGSVELLRDRLPDGSESAAIADEALGASQRGASLVRRLLAFARQQHLEPVAVDLNERLPNIVPLLRRTLGENIRVQVNAGSSLWLARIDPTQVDDALVNMAINARDAMPGGGTLTIETANVALDEDYAAHHVEVEPGDYVMLAVSDTGTGMTPDVAARVFEPFFTTKAEGQGTGLGLSQVFGWVKQSGGHIKVYSELGHGTTIKLYLPRARTKEEASGEASPSAEIGGAGPATILVVEDNPNVRRTVIRQLTDLGYDVIEAENAGSALEKIRDGEQFHLLLTDVVMPGGMSGYELAKEAIRLRPEIRVLFTSGYTALAATELPAAHSGPLISKPYSKGELGRAIRSALETEAGEVM